MFDFDLQLIIIRIPAIIIALTVHEFSHGFAAFLLGDKTAKIDGRLSFNPLRHLDPIGMLCLIFIGFGWAKPVMVDPHQFKYPKQDMAITAAAGPLSNFILAFIVILIYYPLLFLAVTGSIDMDISYVLDFLWVLFSINIVLGIFNLLPIPPLDGSKVFGFLLPEPLYFRFISFRYGIVFLLVLIYSGQTFNIINPIIIAMYNGYFYIVQRIFFFL